ncbi:DUF58 domain-containing protein [Verrucomicrobiota bacterium]
MIVPRDKLLFWVAALLPFCALAALVPGVAGVTVVLSVALLCTAAVDAALARIHTRGVRVTLPEVVRASRTRPAEIPVAIHNEKMRRLEMEIGLALPAAVGSENDTMSVSVPQGCIESGITWPCRPKKRGSFAVKRSHFGIRSPLGFWTARSATDCRSEIRVYPDLLGERRGLAALFLNRGLFGLHSQRTIGQGRDFEKLRKYLPGDSFDDVHWKATAKRGYPVTKLYQVERTQEIYVVLDSSRLSGRTVGSQAALERFITSALILGLVAEKQGDLFGVMTFSDRIRRFIRAGSGKGHYNTCRDALFALTPEATSPDFGELCSFIRLKLRRRALVMILTDLGDPVVADSFLSNIDLVSGQHVVMVSMLKQHAVQPLFSEKMDPEGDLYEKLSGHMIWHDLRELGRSLHYHGASLSLAEDEKLSTELVTQYMSVKARQLI